MTAVDGIVVPASFSYALPRGWECVRLGEVLAPVSRPVALAATATYTLLGMHWYAQGLYVKDRKLGASIQATTLYQVHEGDFVYNRLFAWKGSFGIADASLAGCYVSNEFPCFRVVESRVDPQYLRWCFSQAWLWEAIEAQSSGSTPTSRLRLKEPQLLALEIPLPPLDEQRRIVGRIEALAARVAEARALRREAMELGKQLVWSAAERTVASAAVDEISLADVLREDTLNGLAARPSGEAVGTPILRISAGTTRADAVVDEDDFKYLLADETTVARYALQPGDLVACRFNGNLGNVGKFALYRGSSGKTHVYPDKLIRFRIDLKRARPDYVCIAMNTRRARAAIETFCATTAGNIGISATNLKSVRFPLPSLHVQDRIVAEIAGIYENMSILNQIQARVSANLDALLPSVLDRAFRGQL